MVASKFTSNELMCGLKINFEQHSGLEVALEHTYTRYICKNA